MTAKIHDSQASFEIREAVKLEIGVENIKDFEAWAFKQTPIDYSKDVSYMFERTRSTKFDLPQNNLEAIARIIHMWKHRNDWKLGGT